MVLSTVDGVPAKDIKDSSIIRDFHEFHFTCMVFLFSSLIQCGICGTLETSLRFPEKMSKQPKSEKYVNSDDDESIPKSEMQNTATQSPSPQKEDKQRKAESPTKNEQHVAKKSKTESTIKRNESNEAYWPLSGTKRITVSEFKGKKMVHIREYYMAGDEMKPGKKGIALSVQDFELLSSLIGEIKSECS